MKYFLIAALSIFLSGCRFATVHEGNVYRAPQLKKEELIAAIDAHGIKTIINLRGERIDEEWYKDEKSVAEERGVNLVNIRMSAKSLPHRSNLLKLIDTLKTAPRPILIHCKAGVDRTGEASAIYQMIELNYTKKQALDMLEKKWGHLKKFMPAKRYFIKDIWQGEEWARNEYFPCKANYKFYNKNNSECLKEEAVTKALSTEEDT